MDGETQTAFAPAERADTATLERQHRHFSDAWFFGDLLHRVPDMVLILNGRRQIVYANQAALRAVGAEHQRDVLGRRPGEAFGCTHAARAAGGCGTAVFCRYCGAVEAILESQSGSAAVEECRLNVERGGREEALDLRVWSSPLEVAGERFTFFVLGDIADEKRRHFLERIFLHDLANSASALSGASQILALDTLPPEVRADYTARVGHLTDRIIEEIEAHRQLLAAEHGELRVQAQPLTSLALLREVLEAFAQHQYFEGRSVEIAEGAADAPFESDPSLLRRVLANMVKNALEATGPGERVAAGCIAAEDSVAFWVRNPTYMPENVRVQVFNRSFSTKGPGRGLGTYAMKFLTERCLGGRISFRSDESEGTTFTAWYPRHLRPEMIGRRTDGPSVLV